MAKPRTFEVICEPSENRLMLFIHSDFARVDTNSMTRQIQLAHKRLAKGHTVLTVIGNHVRPVDTDSQLKALELMKVIKMGEPGKLARVVPPLINIQMNRLGAVIGQESRNFNSIEEAISYLDEKAPPSLGSGPAQDAAAAG